MKLWKQVMENGNTLEERNENCDSDFCNPKETLTVLEKLKYPTESRIYVYCSRKNGIQNENSVENVSPDTNTQIVKEDEMKRMGHPHTSYINYPNETSCSSILLFFRSLAPHSPFFRTIVASLYKSVQVEEIVKKFNRNRYITYRH